MNYYHEGFGYQENWLARMQKRLGHDVWAVTSDHYFPFPDYDRTMRPYLGDRHAGEKRFEDEGVVIIRKRSFLAGLRRSGLIVFCIRDVVREFRPDVVHVHGPTNLCLPQVVRFQKKFQYKIFADCHQDDVVSSDDRMLIKKIYHGLWRIFYHGFGMKKKVSCFLPITEGARHWLKSRLRISENETVLLPLGVDLDGMSYDRPLADEFRQKYGIGDRLVIVNAGKQYPEKRIEWVLDVFAAALDMGADVFCVLVGNADETYDRLLTEKLRPFEGRYLRLPFLPREELRQVYSAADVGIWPGIPSNTIQEAMACGVAVILPDNNVVGHLVDENGLLESEDITRAAGFLYALSVDPDKRGICQSRSVEIAGTYDWRVIAEDLMRIYSRE